MVGELADELGGRIVISGKFDAMHGDYVLCGIVTARHGSTGAERSSGQPEHSRRSDPAPSSDLGHNGRGERRRAEQGKTSYRRRTKG
jgi:hypothetical protein